MPQEMPNPAGKGWAGRDCFPGTSLPSDSNTDWRSQLVRDRFDVGSVVAPLIVALFYGEVRS